MDHRVSRRLAVGAALCALAAPALLASGPAAAQGWPNRPVTLIVPFPAGGNTDILARAVAAALSDGLGKQFIADNRAGAGGNIGGAAVAKAQPDGYTLLFSTPGPVAQNRLMYKSMPYDPDRDLVPIVLIANSPLIVTAKKDAPFKTLADLVAAARAAPGKVNAGIPGQGTLGHITSELLQASAKVQFTNVPYRGTSPIITDLLGGQIDVAMDFMSSYVPLVQSGTIKALATTGAKRSASLPDVPTVTETGVANFEASAWYALMAPAGTPSEVIEKTNRVVNAWLKTDKAKEVLASMSMEPNGGTPEELKAYIASEVAKWGPVIKGAGIQF
ncbi:tripartite tricarboxylate transporter substrate binding protein [Rhodoplanes sp. TEM]|uniref:Tripartite tricarboxylate transporter substrate binding protein n=1 Tax=Rhodoplanes tepidamans TaxID=200616 RepID=A0ABT5JJP8_RHOTP|nr:MULTISPECIES: tripartite tricarboxylate transporter substrate binding protein [Rhodoplanes]MDC7789713.1 tripartite tricarboxylate transporter substrate binding protein [Rhodoplanes tepidamans]MDC7985862.1 tripartite tricarboxylate transporter substrate binding protein [Rhodoplanes sp. TEM]MDQ0354390.1 tripartite-type tricarboxylate transporter receptor subunit TctC [Rhodoplanes tepidamans]